jgi:membrane protease YdiL (CAAX protease family)
LQQETPQPNPIFFGDDGLRAGWSIALFLSPFLLIFALIQLMSRNQPAAPATAANLAVTPSAAIFGEALPFLFFAAAAFGMSRLERRAFTRYGLAFKRLLPDLAAGLAWGFVMLSLLIAALAATHSIAFDGFSLHGLQAFAYAIKWAIAFLFVGLLEEFLFRGYLQFTLARGISGIVSAISPRNPDAHLIGFWVAAFILSGGIFAYTHTSNQGETLTGILAVACAGGVFAFSLWRTGSLWWGIGFHAAWDWAQSYLYGTPDSGGLITGHLLATHPAGSPVLSGASDGPEGSILAIPALLLAALIIHLTLPRRIYPLTPDQSPPEQRIPPHLQLTG